MDLIKKNDLEVLLFTDDIDEFMANILNKYEDLEFKSINQGDLDLLDDETKEEVKEKEETNKKLLKQIKKALKEKVSDVKLSTRLTDSPVCIVSGEGLSLEMEKVLKNMPQNNQMKAQRILEINPNHDLFKMLEKITDNKKIDKYSTLLYNQALLIEGIELENPVEFSNLLVDLMIESNK